MNDPQLQAMHYGEEGSPVACPRKRSSRLSMRKGRSIVHKNLEDNYGAVITANHEAIAQVLEQVDCCFCSCFYSVHPFLIPLFTGLPEPPHPTYPAQPGRCDESALCRFLSSERVGGTAHRKAGFLSCHMGRPAPASHTHGVKGHGTEQHQHQEQLCAHPNRTVCGPGAQLPCGTRSGGVKHRK